MRKLLLSSAIVLSLVGGASAMASTKAHKAETSAPSQTASKSSECARQWKAEKAHTQSHKAFIAACNKA